MQKEMSKPSCVVEIQIVWQLFEIGIRRSVCRSDIRPQSSPIPTPRQPTNQGGVMMLVMLLQLSEYLPCPHIGGHLYIFTYLPFRLSFAIVCETTKVSECYKL